MYANSNPITPPTKASAKSQKQYASIVNFSLCGGSKITPALRMSTINYTLLYVR